MHKHRVTACSRSCWIRVFKLVQRSVATFVQTTALNVQRANFLLDNSQKIDSPCLTSSGSQNTLKRKYSTIWWMCATDQYWNLVELLLADLLHFPVIRQSKSWMFIRVICEPSRWSDEDRDIQSEARILDCEMISDRRACCRNRRTPRPDSHFARV